MNQFAMPPLPPTGNAQLDLLQGSDPRNNNASLYLAGMGSKSSTGRGGVSELLQLWPEAANTIQPAEILQIWSDDKIKDFAFRSTDDMEHGGMRVRCAQACADEDMKIQNCEGLIHGYGYRDEGSSEYRNQERRVQDLEYKLREFGFNPEKDKAERDPLDAAIAKENGKMLACEAELEAAKKLHEDAVTGTGDVINRVASTEAVKLSMEKIKNDATEDVKRATVQLSTTTATKASTQKVLIALKPLLTKAADALKKATENAEAKDVADAALLKATDDFRVADAAFEFAKQREEAEKVVVKEAELRLKELTAAQMEAKKAESAAKTALSKASAELKKAKGDAIQAATIVEADAAVVLAQASEVVANLDIELAQIKQALSDAKAADKDTDTEFKNATKIQGDTKRAEAKAADTASKAAAKIAQQTAPLETLSNDFVAMEEQMKKATDDAAAADIADSEAKQALANAKQAEKDADTALKTAIKATVDAKSDDKKHADLIKKLQVNVEQVQVKLKNLSGSMSILTTSVNKLNNLNTRNAERKVKFDKATEELAIEQAKLLEFKQQIEDAKAAKLRFCKEAIVHDEKNNKNKGEAPHTKCKINVN